MSQPDPPPDAVVPGGEVYRVPPWFFLPAALWPGNWLKPKPAPPAPKPTPEPPSPTPGLSVQVILALNVERAKRGLPPLGNDSGLVGTAQYWASVMAGNNILTHGPIGAPARRIATVYPGRASAENIAKGDVDVPSVVAGWMSDLGHLANVLGPYTLAGAAKAVTKDGVPFWVLDLVGPA